MKKVAALLCLLFAGPLCWGQEPARTAGPPITATGPSVSIPESKEVLVGQRFSIAPTVKNAGTPRWYIPDPGGLREDRTFLYLIPDRVTIDGKEVEFAALLKGRVFYSDSPGQFRIVVYCAGDNRVASDIAVCMVTVTAPGPPPPPQPPPAPSDPLFPSLSAAYGTDGSPASQARSLASVYRVASTATVNDAKLLTAADLLATVHRAAESLTPLPILKTTRNVIAAELRTKLPAAPSTPLDPSTRKLCGEQFARMAALLEAVAR